METKDNKQATKLISALKKKYKKRLVQVVDKVGTKPGR